MHNKYFDHKLPDWASVFNGTPLVVIISFPIMVSIAVITCFVWPTIQDGINGLQTFLVNAGAFGVWAFTLLERLLIPTGLHHFVYGPVFYGPVAVDGGTVAYWIQHIQDFAANSAPLTEQFPQGGLMLTGMGKVFGCTGIALALYSTAKPEKKKMVLGLVLGAAITAILTGITEPIEFTFLFIALRCLLCMQYCRRPWRLSHTCWVFQVTSKQVLSTLFSKTGYLLVPTTWAPI